MARAGDDRLVTRRALADATGAPASVLAQALALLVRARLLEAHAGPRGGYRLARPAAKVTIRDVVTAIDPEDPEPRCVLREAACPTEGEPCAFHAFLVDAQRSFLDMLGSASLADVIAGTQHERDRDAAARQTDRADRPPRSRTASSGTSTRT